MGRVKQFLLDLTAFTRETDTGFINEYLNDEEKKLFLKLRKAEILHAVTVAKGVSDDIENGIPNNLGDISDEEKHYIVKMALVHDIGKIKYRMNVIQKSIAVLLDKTAKDKNKLKNSSKMMDTYYGHPEYGREYLKKVKAFDEFPYLYEVIGSHHKGLNKTTVGTDIDLSKAALVLALLKKSDDES
ncbi:MAG: HD domain-containing protein [Clostridiaceae bacterium]